jgi:hypothetical protein
MFKKTTQPAVNHEAESLAVASGEVQRILAVKWWRWRHLYLEAKRLQVEVRRQSGA